MYPKNLINEKIAAFYEDITDKDCLDDVDKYFYVNHTLKFKEIYAFMQSVLNFERNIKILADMQNFDYDDFLFVYKKVKPIFLQSHFIIKTVDIEKLSLNWLGNNYSQLIVLKSESNVHGTENVEKILVLTAMLEFALGSVFCTLSGLKTPPHLLKDLLCTKELEMFFGLEALTFLKLIIGTPKAINLRNIVWHGFPKPDSIPTYYVSTLLILIHSLGQMLQTKQIQLSYRKQIADFSAFIKTVCVASNTPNHFVQDEKNFRDKLDSCYLILPEYKPFWHQLYLYFKTATYWRFVILILPQIELLLRLLYAKSNDYDVSAKLDEYYITLDTIFEPTVPNNANKHNNFFSNYCDRSNGVLHFIYDIFLAPKGPRLRDKISHGEVLMEAINNEQISHALLVLAFNLLSLHEEDYSLFNYESQFNINSFAKIALNNTSKTFNEFVSNEFAMNFEIDLSFDLIKDKVKIFRRPKKESVHMLIITRIANLLNNTCQNFEESIRLRQSLLLNHELHSKRRRTFENLMNTLPTFCSCLCLIMKCLFEIYRKLQASDQDTLVDDTVVMQRFLKQTQRIAENFVKYSHKDSNEWIKIIDLSKDFDELYKRLFLKLREIGLS